MSGQGKNAASLDQTHDWSNYGYGYPAYYNVGTWPTTTATAASSTSSTSTITSGNATATTTSSQYPPPPPRPVPSPYDSYYAGYFVRPSDQQQQLEQQPSTSSYKPGQKRPYNAANSSNSNLMELSVGDLLQEARQEHDKNKQNEFEGRNLRPRQRQRLRNKANLDQKPKKMKNKNKNKNKNKDSSPTRGTEANKIWKMSKKDRRRFVNRIMNKQGLSKEQVEKERYVWRKLKPVNSFQHPWLKAEGGTPTKNLTVQQWLEDEDLKLRIADTSSNRVKAPALLAQLTKGLISLTYDARTLDKDRKISVTVLVGGQRMGSAESTDGETAMSSANWIALEKLFQDVNLCGKLKHTKHDPPLPPNRQGKYKQMSKSCTLWQGWKEDQVPKLEGIALSDLKGREVMREAMPCKSKYHVVVSSMATMLETLTEVPREQWSLVESEHEGSFSLEIAEAGIMVEDHFGADVDEDERQELLAHKALCAFKGDNATWRDCATELLDKLIEKTTGDMVAYLEAHDEKNVNNEYEEMKKAAKRQVKMAMRQEEMEKWQEEMEKRQEEMEKLAREREAAKNQRKERKKPKGYPPAKFWADY